MISQRKNLSTLKIVKSEEQIKPKFKFSHSYISEDIINANIYLNEYLKKRQIPFISNHHDKQSDFFWLDMLSSHYEKIVISYLKSLGINFQNEG